MMQTGCTIKRAGFHVSDDTNYDVVLVYASNLIWIKEDIKGSCDTNKSVFSVSSRKQLNRDIVMSGGYDV